MKKTKVVGEFNGYSFEDSETAKRMKYLVVFDGDLDLNGCYAFKSKKDLVFYLKYADKKCVAFEIKYLGKFNKPQ